MMQQRTLSIMGDGGFWHNGLLTGVQSALFNNDDAVLLIFKNGYSSATGTQELISTPSAAAKDMAAEKMQSLTHTNTTIESTLQGLGVQWLRTVHTYKVDQMRKTLKEAFTSDFNGLKVIVAEGECQLERPAPHQALDRQPAQERQARGAGEVRRRRGRVQRRPRLHPAFRLPDAHHQGQPGSAEGGPGGDGDRRLRGLRPVRRERARPHACAPASTAPRSCRTEVARARDSFPARRRVSALQPACTRCTNQDDLPVDLRPWVAKVAAC
jgi:hypothetical protein